MKLTIKKTWLLAGSLFLHLWLRGSNETDTAILEYP